MTEELSDFPECFAESEQMPWEIDPRAGERYRWLWGLDRGKPLGEIDSRELVRKRAWLESQMGPGRAYAGLVMEIDKELTNRGGELR